MRYGDVARKLASVGCEVVSRRGKGSHRVWHNPANGRLTTVPDWGSKDLKPGTVPAAIKQLGLQWEEFVKI
jgi:mRNA interferase HicA